MATLAGIYVGLTLVTPTSGVCRTGQAGFELDHVYSDRYSREAALGTSTFDVLAVDGPILPGSQLNYAPRICEKIFVSGTRSRLDASLARAMCRGLAALSVEAAA